MLDDWNQLRSGQRATSRAPSAAWLACHTPNATTRAVKRGVLAEAILSLVLRLLTQAGPVQSSSPSTCILPGLAFTASVPRYPAGHDKHTSISKSSHSRRPSNWEHYSLLSYMLGAFFFSLPVSFFLKFSFAICLFPKQGIVSLDWELPPRLFQWSLEIPRYKHRHSTTFW